MGRRVKWTESGMEYEVDPKHGGVILECFGFEEGSRPLTQNGDKHGREEAWEEEELGKAEAKVVRGVGARFSFVGARLPRPAVPQLSNAVWRWRSH